ncbi:MAG: GIY-YIG nuclease family protein [Planctomycetaceae bacterium]
MITIFMLFFGIACGAGAVYALLEKKRYDLATQEIELRNRSLEISSQGLALQARESQLAQQTQDLKNSHIALNAQVVSYNDRVTENQSLKRELHALYQRWRKSCSDHFQLEKTQQELDARCQKLGRKHLDDHTKWIFASLNANNYATKKNQLHEAIGDCEELGVKVPPEEIKQLYTKLENEYRMAVKAAMEREEQARINAQIREEQKRDREFKQELERIEREKELVSSALAKALAKAHGEHTAEIDSLRAKLAEAESNQRAISQAQLTRSGNVYVISNIGSFGENVFKIGMTRRLEPMDRVLELGDASVPFPFDVHMMIATDNAPALENTLHQKFHHRRINKINLRKEFFKVSLDEIVQEVEKQHGQIAYKVDAEALQYRNSMEMSEEDASLVEEIYEQQLQTSGADDE